MTKIPTPNLEPGEESEHSAPGGAVFRTGLTPREGRVVRLPCGCSSDDFRWLTFCEKVKGKVHERHSSARVINIREAATAADPLLS